MEQEQKSHRALWYIPENIRVHWLGFMLWGAMLFPAFYWPGVSFGLPFVRWEEILLAFGLIMNGFAGLIAKRLTPCQPLIDWQGKERKLLLAVLMFVGWIILSDIYGWLFLNVPLTFRDGMELITIGKYLLLMMIGASIPINHKSVGTLLRYLYVAFVISNALSWAQAGNWFNVNTWLTPWMAPGHLGNLTKAAIPRVIGTFGNPNYTGIFAALGFLMAAFAYLTFRSPVWLVIALLAAKLQIMVISRTALLAMIVGFVVLLLELKIGQKDSFKISEISLRRKRLMILTVGIIAIVLFSPNYFFERLNEGVHVQTSSSANQHFVLWQMAWKDIQRSPVFGWGTAKAIMTPIVDNEYLLLWRRYGIIGLMGYGYIYLNLWRIAPKTGGARPILHSVIVTLLVFNMAAGTWYSLQLMALLWPLVGLLLAKQRNEGCFEL